MEKNSQRIVSSLYKSLSGGDTQAAATLLASDLEWWFHGPPGREYMMRILTGVEDVRLCGFRFEPHRVVEAGKWVVAEGWGFSAEADDAYWVHAWAVEGGVITQLREYFNTSITIRELGRDRGSSGEPTLWESRKLGCRELPGLVLAV